MEKEITIYQREDIEKKHENFAKNLNENEENSHNFRKLMAEIVVEIIIKKRKNGCNRVYKDK